MMLDLVVGFLCGMAAHQADRFVKQFPSDWRELTRYTIGTLTVLIAFLFTLSRTKDRSERGITAALLIADTGVGAGVAAARLLDVMEIKR